MLDHVQPGQKIKIKAFDWNAIVDAARAHRGTGIGNFASDKGMLPQGVLAVIHNSSGSAVDKGGVLGLDAPIVLPADNEDAFKSKLFFEGVTPSIANHSGKYAIMLDPTPDSGTGRGFIAGACIVQLNVIDEAQADYAEVGDSVDGLVAGPSGSATVLWREGDTGWQWAVVRIGNKITTGVPLYNATGAKRVQGDVVSVAFNYALNCFQAFETWQMFSNNLGVFASDTEDGETGVGYIEGICLAKQSLMDSFTSNLVVYPGNYFFSPGPIGQARFLGKYQYGNDELGWVHLGVTDIDLRCAIRTEQWNMSWWEWNSYYPSLIIINMDDFKTVPLYPIPGLYLYLGRK